MPINLAKRARGGEGVFLTYPQFQRQRIKIGGPS
jgi:hypothetical protein